jgi:hypothetical protein
VEVISRAEAKAAGLKKYFTGVPCKHGHEASRWVRNGSCVTCEYQRQLAYARKAYAKNPEKTLEWQRAYRQNHPENRRATTARYCERHPERRRASSIEYYRRNRGKYLEYNRRRADGEKSATPPWADVKAIEAVYREAARLTEKTGVPHHVDHEVPLKGVNSKGEHVVCGLHVHNNLRAIPAQENRKKSNRFEEALC